MKRTVGILSLFSATAIVVACSSNKPNPPMTPTTTADAGSDGGSMMSPDGGMGAPSASTPAPNFFTDAGAAPTASATNMTDQAFDIALDALIAAAAAKNAPKMAQEGAPGRQTMKEGDHLAMMVTMQPNRCYTIIATALPGTVVQLDSKLYAPPFYNVDAGHSGANDKALPIIGKGTAALCPILPIAVPYKLDVAATKGAGRIAVHVYSRAK